MNRHRGMLVHGVNIFRGAGGPTLGALLIPGAPRTAREELRRRVAFLRRQHRHAIGPLEHGLTHKDLIDDAGEAVQIADRL